MKRNIYLLLLAVVSLTARTQTYQPMDSTFIWSTHEYYKYMNQCMVRSYFRYKMEGYTLNNGRIWNKVYGLGASTYEGMCGSPNSPFYSGFAAYVYNDIQNRKVYLVRDLPANYDPMQSDLLYDFNKAVGDTFFAAGSYKIDSIDSLLFSGKYHKRFHTSAVGGSPLPGGVTFVEGIGASIGAFVHSTFFESGTQLLCFASPSQTMVINGSAYQDGYCEGLTIGLSENNGHHALKLYPNPFHDLLFVDLPATLARIYDATGRLVLEKQTSGGKGYLETEDLSPGIYFVKAGAFTGKVIKD